MIHFRCRHCGQPLHASDTRRGYTFKCTSCGKLITVTTPLDAWFNATGEALERLIGRLLIMVFAAVALGVVGYYVGQHKPFFGGPAALLAQEGSVLKNQLAYQHAVFGGILGAVLGLLATVQKGERKG